MIMILFINHNSQLSVKLYIRTFLLNGNLTFKLILLKYSWVSILVRLVGPCTGGI